MGETKIEWTDKVWNPVTGCTKVSAGCKNCYAERLFHRPYPGRDFGDVRCHPERLEEPLHWRKPCRIFVNSMSDLFHESVGDEFIGSIFAIMLRSVHHTFQILTKRPERMICWFSDWYANQMPSTNVWLGVSIEDQKTADERIPLLLQTPAAVRFVSYEPALGPVDFGNFLGGLRTGDPHWPPLDWVIAGGESGPGARPSHPDWFRSVRDQCQAAGVPFFLKQWGNLVHLRDEHGSELNLDSLAHGEQAFSFAERNCWGIFRRIRKKRAGRLLDGREWNEFPSADRADF